MWIFDSLPNSGARKGGNAADQVFPADIDTFVREVLQNSLDQAREVDDVPVYPVRVQFRLEELSTDRQDELLGAVDWDVLREHLEDSRDHGGTTIAGRLKSGLELVEDRKLRVMTIEDRGTRGLTGDEDGTDSNFANLCKHELVTSGNRGESGGSFGIGKSVLWRFSDLSTVFFSSRPEDRDCLRFIGRTELPTHDAQGDSWAGPGWFGVPEERQHGMRAVSIEDVAGEEAATYCGVFRGPEDYGTSIVVLGFDDPAHEDEPSVEVTCRSVMESALRWFWPALRDGKLELHVKGLEGETLVFDKSANLEGLEVEEPLGGEILPFLETMDADPGEFIRPGDVMEHQIVFTIPGRSPDHKDGESPQSQVQATLLLRKARADDPERWLNTVALQRGTGMVVMYRPSGDVGSSKLSYYGVLLAGRSNGSEAADHELEKFLRAAEPPAHNAWNPRTDRIREEYKSYGRVAALNSLFGDIDATLRSLVQETVVESDEVPDFLRKMLPFGGSGMRERRPRLQMRDVAASLSDGNHWNFEGQLLRTSAPQGTWWFKVHLDVDQEGSGSARTRIPLSSLLVPGCEVEIVEDGSYATIEVPQGITEVPFSGSTAVAPVPDPNRTALRLNADLTDKGGN